MKISDVLTPIEGLEIGELFVESIISKSDTCNRLTGVSRKGRYIFDVIDYETNRKLFKSSYPKRKTPIVVRKVE